ncbi:enhancer of mRNA decapping [Basidiobolus ranarum]|uniref:Enhancer of mRNA decapping n=1 Tax=Basidiobolus ranarum TaxID=34480 RepID=A0ABR2X0P8_9FUNG
MTEAFIGLRVRINLTNGLNLEGLVSSIDQQTQHLVLTNVLSSSNGIQQHLPTMGVTGSAIQDLQIIPSEVQSPPPRLQFQPQPSMQTFLPQKKIPNKNLANITQKVQPTRIPDFPPSSGLQYPPQIPNAASPTIFPLPMNFTNRISPQPILPHDSLSQEPLHRSQEHQQQRISHGFTSYKQEVAQPVKYPKPAPSSPPYPSVSREYISNLPTQRKAPHVDPAIVSYSQPTKTHITASYRQGTYKASHGPSPNTTGYSGSTTSAFIPPPSIELSVHDVVDICLDYKNLCSDTEDRTINDLDGLDSDQPHIVQSVNTNRRSRPKGNKLRPSPSPGSQIHRYPHSPGRSTNTWAAGNVNDYRREEFDFEHNLGLFDKKKVFAEIKELDSTDPDGLLVNINRNTGYKPTRSSLKNYGPLENVLEDSRKQRYYEEEDELDEEDNDTANEESDLENWKKKQEPEVIIRTLTGITCPFVTRAQMGEIEKIAITETGPSEEQIIENSGRSAAIMCLKALGGSRRIQPNNHNDAPLVVVLAGNTKTGIFGLSAARHLANHGCEVIVCVTGKEREVLKGITTQSKYLRATGGKIVRSAAELPEPYTTPVDLIMDALLGYQPSARDSDLDYDLAFIGDLIDWANDNKAPVLSLDMPSGFKGQPNNDNVIHPKWTLCLGAPRFGLKNRNMTGEIFLADIGIPRILYKKVGVRGWRMPWGAEYLVGLEYA